MNKAEIQLLHNSIQAAEIEAKQKLSEAQLVWLRASDKNLDELPPQKETYELMQCSFKCIAVEMLLRVLGQPTLKQTTRASLLALSAKETQLNYPLTFENDKEKDILKSIAALLDSIPTPETLTSGSIDKSVHMIAKAAQYLPKIPIVPKEETPTAAAVAVAKDKGKEVAVNVRLQAGFAPIAPNLTPFDLSVMQAAASIYASGSKTFSTNQLYRVLTGADAHTKITSKATLEAVKKSLDTLQATIITIDAEQQAALGKYRRYDWNKTTFKGYLLPMTKIETAYYSGNQRITKCDCWRIIDTPPLLAYSKTIKQVATIPQKVKCLPKGVSATVKNICIRDTLLYYIHLNRGKGVRLNYSTLFEAAGADTSNWDTCYKMRKVTRALLKYWQEIGFMPGETDVITGAKKDIIYIS